MNKKIRNLIALILVSALVLACIPMTAGAYYNPPVDTLKIGLKYGSEALDGANLLNEVGSGYEFGYFDSNRQFVPIGASTAETAISMVIDKNVGFVSDNYYEVGTRPITVGCFHIKLGGFPTYIEAATIASQFAGGFVKYSEGMFYAMVGNFTSYAEAELTAFNSGLTGCVIDSGTSNTIAVVKTGTNTVLFEYENSAFPSLAVRPIQNGLDKTKTWFKGYCYYGAFQYTRIGGGKLTVVNFIGIEDYVKGVIPYEISPSWPVEAQKAMAVCARSYALANLNKHSSHGFDVCNTTDCQVYYGTGSANATSDSCVDMTAGEYMMANGSLCTAYYCSSNGGATENSENVWTNAISYLRGKQDPYEANIANSVSNYYWTKTMTGYDIASYLNAKGHSCSAINTVKLELTEMGNVRRITFIDAAGRSLSFSGDRARTILGFRSLRYRLADGTSTGGVAGDVYVNAGGGILGVGINEAYGIGISGIGRLGGRFAISAGGTISEVQANGAGSGAEIPTGTVLTYTGNTFTFAGSGHGHNVGMSQWGAYSMAKYHNKTYRDILTFYFSGVTIG